MTQDLDVETTLIRQAADILDDAGRIFGGSAGGGELTCPLTDASLGPTALGREVVAGASKRVRQAAEAADRLGVLSSDTAGKLRTSANAFEQAESSAISGPA
jgi:hypothetical protein